MPNNKLTQMLYPVCQVQTPQMTATGIFVHEKYILTVFHCIEDSITIKGSQKSYEEVRHKVDVTFYEQNKIKTAKALIISYDEAQDIALLKLIKQKSQHIAKVVPTAQIPKCEIFDDLYIVGAPLDQSPMPTRGILSSKSEQVEHGKYWMTDAWIQTGNSGSGVFKLINKKYYLIGMASRSLLNDEQADTNLTHFIPPDSIYSFLNTVKESDFSLS